MVFVTEGAKLDTTFEQCKNNLFLIRRYSDELEACYTEPINGFQIFLLSAVMKQKLFSSFHFL